jgi:PAS domain S-box-containing protein
MSAPPPGGREGEIFQGSDARYRGLLEAAPDAMVVVNQGGEIVLLNVQAEKQFCYARDEVVGQKVTNIIPVGFAERLIADDLRSAAEALAQQIGTGIELTALRRTVRSSRSRSDEMQLVQLFQNLVGNAIKSQSNGTPRVHISAVRTAPRLWRFAVQDNGLGIDPQYFEKIFGMFQRLHRRDEFAGTGIGLAICKKIVERHGGTISVESQPGEGSTFRFALIGSE